MCLRSAHTTPSVASSDITVVKMLRMCRQLSPRSDGKGVLSTPYRWHSVRLGELLEAGDIKWERTRIAARWKDDLSYGIHAYQSMYHAGTHHTGFREYIRGHRSIRNPQWAFKAVIPQGTQYFLGKSGDIIAQRMRLCRAYTLAEIRRGYPQLFDTHALFAPYAA
jgi:hypothetical protein